jgi:hypothetical protein
MFLQPVALEALRRPTSSKGDQPDEELAFIGSPNFPKFFCAQYGGLTMEQGRVCWARRIATRGAPTQWNPSGVSGLRCTWFVISRYWIRIDTVRGPTISLIQDSSRKASAAIRPLRRQGGTALVRSGARSAIHCPCSQGSEIWRCVVVCDNDLEYE